MHWVVKDGCEDNSTILHDAGLLYGDDVQCAVMAPSPELPQTTTGLLYAWGRCTDAGIEMGYGGSEAECAGSMNQTDGAYRITLVDKTHHGRCVCHPRPDAPSSYDTFTCTETTTTTTTAPMPKALASRQTTKRRQSRTQVMGHQMQPSLCSWHCSCASPLSGCSIPSACDIRTVHHFTE